MEFGDDDMLVKGDKFLILRYSNGIYDCIKKHKEVLNKIGYCWFGKIGVVPSESALNAKLNADKPLVVLYCQGDVHIANLLTVSSEKPLEGYPDYYNDFLYRRNIYPKMYFKLGSLEELSKDTFAKCVSLSSGRPLNESIARSMASFFYGEYPLENTSVPSLPVKSGKKREIRQKEHSMRDNSKVDKYSCVYEDEGLCTNRRCINYGYECERPSSCMKQKPRLIEE